MRMARVYYKLIRDQIPQKIEQKGETCEVRTLEDEEYGQELLKKVREEASGLATVRSREGLIEELSDLYAVLDALVEQQCISSAELAQSRAENMRKKGGFTKRLFLHWSSDNGYVSNETPQGVRTQ